MVEKQHTVVTEDIHVLPTEMLQLQRAEEDKQKLLKWLSQLEPVLAFSVTFVLSIRVLDPDLGC